MMLKFQMKTRVSDRYEDGVLRRRPRLEKKT